MRAIVVLGFVLAACVPDFADHRGRCSDDLPCAPGSYCYRSFCVVDRDAGSSILLDIEAGRNEDVDEPLRVDAATTDDPERAVDASTATQSPGNAAPASASNAEPAAPASPSADAGWKPVTESFPADASSSTVPPAPTQPTAPTSQPTTSPMTPPATQTPDAEKPTSPPAGDASSDDGEVPKDCSVEKCCNQGKGPSKNNGEDDAKKKACTCDPALTCTKK